MNLTKKKWPKKIYLYLEKLNKKKERGFIQKINPGHIKPACSDMTAGQ